MCTRVLVLVLSGTEHARYAYIECIHVKPHFSWVLLLVAAVYSRFVLCWLLLLPLLLLLLLQILVELAIERQQELPALIYESRPTNRPYQRGMWRRQPARNSSAAADGSSGGPGGTGVVTNNVTNSGAGLAHVAVAGGGGVLAGDVSGSPSVSARVALLGEQQRSWDEAAQVSQEMALAGGSNSSVGSGNGSARYGSARRRASGNGDRSGNGAVPLAEGREEQGDWDVQQHQLLLWQRKQQCSDAAWHVRQTAAAAATAACRRGEGPLGEGVEDGPAAAAGSSSSSGGGLLHAADGR
jgi:hypothetical protein